MACTNTYPEILKKLKHIFGGSMRSIKKRFPHHRQAYEWEVCGIRAVEAAEALLPYLREKKTQALLLRTIHEADPGDTRGALVECLSVLKKKEYHDGL